MFVVDVLTLLARVAAEVEETLLLVDLHDTAGAEGAAGDRVLQRPVPLVEVVVPPAGALRPPEHLVLAVLEVADALVLDVALLEPVLDEGLRLAGADVRADELDVPEQAVAADETQLGARHLPLVLGLVLRALLVFLFLVLVLLDRLPLGQLAPVDVGVALVLPHRRYAEELLPGAVEEEELALVDVFLAGHRVGVLLQGGARLGKGIHQEELGDVARVTAGRVERGGVGCPGDIGASLLGLVLLLGSVFLLLFALLLFDLVLVLLVDVFFLLLLLVVRLLLLLFLLLFLVVLAEEAGPLDEVVLVPAVLVGVLFPEFGAAARETATAGEFVLLLAVVGQLKSLALVDVVGPALALIDLILFLFLLLVVVVALLLSVVLLVVVLFLFVVLLQVVVFLLLDDIVLLFLLLLVDLLLLDVVVFLLLGVLLLLDVPLLLLLLLFDDLLVLDVGLLLQLLLFLLLLSFDLLFGLAFGFGLLLLLLLLLQPLLDRLDFFFHLVGGFDVVEVVVLKEDVRRPVGREVAVRPRILLLLLVLLFFGGLPAAAELPLHLLAAPVSRALLGLALVGQDARLQIQLEAGLFQDEAERRALVVDFRIGKRQRELVDRLAQLDRQFGREILVVEERLLLPLGRVDDRVVRSLAGLVAVPEVIRLADPLRGYGGAVDPLAQVVGVE